MNPVLTDWLTIATAGPTVDGRSIKEEWLRDAAETYDRNEYVAFLNVEHWTGNLGAVWDVRLGKDKKERTVLQARIRPNKYYLQQNAEDHRLCFSVELVHNFCGSGRTYLTGLATTDFPASVGTTEARFSREDVFRGAPETIENIPLMQENPSVAETVKNALKDFFTKNKESEMTKEEFSEALKPLTEAVAALKETVTAMNTKPEAQDVRKTDVSADFSAKLEAIAAGLEKLSAKMEEALTPVPPRGGQPGIGDTSDEPLI